jgi:hypothetical protein
MTTLPLGIYEIASNKIHLNASEQAITYTIQVIDLIW